MKRRGCIGCRLIEPRPGQWIGGRCPRCAESFAGQQAQSAGGANTAIPKRDETVERLRSYITRIAAEYPNCWQNVDRLRASRGKEGVPDWPQWCFLPLAGAYAIASGGMEGAPPERLGAIAALGALAAWRPTQGIYRFDETVLTSVWDTPITGEIPTEVLHRIPEWCVYIETPGASYMDAPSPGFFAFLEFDANYHREELRFAIDNGAGQLMTAMSIHLDRGSLIGGLQHAISEAARQAELFAQRYGTDSMEEAHRLLNIPPGMLAEALTPRINLLLYLCSTNAEIAGHVRHRPRETRTKQGPRLFPPDATRVWQVGFRLGAAIRHANQEATPRSKAGEGTHASPRAAHPQGSLAPLLDRTEGEAIHRLDAAQAGPTLAAANTGECERKRRGCSYSAPGQELRPLETWKPWKPLFPLHS